MEPLVKLEPCEDLYIEQNNGCEIAQNRNNSSMLDHGIPLQTQDNPKRFYHDVEENATLGGNINYHNANTYYQTSQEFPYQTSNLTPDFNCNNQDATRLEQNQINTSEGQPLKRRKLEENVLFNPPFFKLMEEMVSPSNKDAIAARCYSCGKIVKGNRGISSNFIKHMKRSHPEINKMYETYKAHKMKTGQCPNRAQMTREFISANENSDTNSYCMIEATGADESSDDNEESLMANKEMLETNESSKESSQQPVLNHQNASIELSAKTLEAIGNIINEKIKNFVKQKDYEQLNEKVNTLIKECYTSSTSKNTSHIELKAEMENLKKECSILRSAVQKSQASRRQLQNELQTVDKVLHQRKLIIRNIQVYDVEQPIKSVEKLLHEKLNLNDIKILNCSIIPCTKTSTAESNKESLSIELENSQSCKLILRQAHKLKNTGIFIETEISTFQRRRKNKLMVLRKELLKRKMDLKVSVRDTTLIVNGKKFYWDDVEGLCHDSKQEEAMELNGVEYLNRLCGLDLREFINVLQNYNVQIN